jgi:hypothetical protein
MVVLVSASVNVWVAAIDDDGKTEPTAADTPQNAVTATITRAPRNMSR